VTSQAASPKHEIAFNFISSFPWELFIVPETQAKPLYKVTSYTANISPVKITVFRHVPFSTVFRCIFYIEKLPVGNHCIFHKIQQKNVKMTPEEMLFLPYFQCYFYYIFNAIFTIFSMHILPLKNVLLKITLEDFRNHF
jgi:hypothetical protein